KGDPGTAPNKRPNPTARAAFPREPAPLPENPKWAAPTPQSPVPLGMRDTFKQMGAEHFCQWVRQQKRLLLTDTTFRDAHQSLLATRMRGYDMLRIAPFYAQHLS